MINIADIPPDAPAKFVYMLSKADLYLKIGPNAYRKGDAFGLPDESLSPEDLAILRHGMEQICQFRGYDPAKPFRDLDIHGFYTLMRTLHFKLECQALVEFRGETDILDKMDMVHAIDGEGIVLYNLVPRPSSKHLI
jgi:hypothetical protein